MKKILSVFTLLSSLTFAANSPQLEGDYLHCWDGKTELAFYSDSRGVLEEGTTPLELLQMNNTMKIRTNGKTYTYTNNVIIMTDGAGNDAVQVLVSDTFGPIQSIVEFTFEHEGSYLSGFYSLPNEGVDLANTSNSTYEFSEPIYFENMTCDF